jgi:hypothetical protein
MICGSRRLPVTGLIQERKKIIAAYQHRIGAKSDRDDDNLFSQLLTWRARLVCAKVMSRDEVSSLPSQILHLPPWRLAMWMGNGR